MAQWDFTRINYIPMTLGIVCSSGLVSCFIIALLRGDVSPYLPFISETGGKYPEAGLFSISLYITATMGLLSIFIRFLIVEELNRGIDRAIDYLNKASLVVGFFALMGMVVVAAYPMLTVRAAHGIGANFFFFGGVIYAALQTAQSYKMCPYYNGLAICYIRLVITLLSIVALTIMLVSMPIAYNLWTSTTHSHWTGDKTPDDKGFYVMVIGSTAEWSMAILFMAFYFTYIREFGKCCIHLRMEVLVNHFNEEVGTAPILVATERTPIVM